MDQNLRRLLSEKGACPPDVVQHESTGTAVAVMLAGGGVLG